MSVDELIRGVVIALGSQPVSVCPAMDRNGSGEVTIDELIAAIGIALDGCPPTLASANSSTARSAHPALPHYLPRKGR